MHQFSTRPPPGIISSCPTSLGITVPLGVQAKPIFYHCDSSPHVLYSLQTDPTHHPSPCSLMLSTLSLELLIFDPKALLDPQSPLGKPLPFPYPAEILVSPDDPAISTTL